MGKRILYVGLSRPKTFKIGSVLIRWAESPKELFNPQSWFALFNSSHVFSLFPAHPRRPFYLVNEAAGTMVRWISQPHFEDHAAILNLYRFEFDEATYRLIRTYGELHAGAPYAFAENIGIAFVRVVKLITGKTIANPFGAGEGIQKCSELIIRNIVSRVAALPQLRTDLFNERGHVLPSDIEVIGVRDIYEVLEYLADGLVCERVPTDSVLRIGEPELKAVV